MPPKSKTKTATSRKTVSKTKSAGRKPPAAKSVKKATNKPVGKSLAGKTAPAFTMPTESGAPISLKALRGKRVVLFFYPKDDTAGCTAEAQSFRDAKTAFARKGVTIVGVSKDTVESHKKFKTKHKLNFDLASDAETKVCEAYGVWKEKNMYGRKYMGIERSTFLIDEKGVVRAEWRKVRVPGHVEEVAGLLKKL